MHMLTTFLVNVTCKDVYIQVKNKMLVYSISHDTAVYRKEKKNQQIVLNDRLTTNL